MGGFRTARALSGCFEIPGIPLPLVYCQVCIPEMYSGQKGILLQDGWCHVQSLHFEVGQIGSGAYDWAPPSSTFGCNKKWVD